MSFITLVSLANNSLCLQSGLKCDDSSRLFYFSGSVPILQSKQSVYFSKVYNRHSIQHKLVILKLIHLFHILRRVFTMAIVNVHESYENFAHDINEKEVRLVTGKLQMCFWATGQNDFCWIFAAQISVCFVIF